MLDEIGQSFPNFERFNRWLIITRKTDMWVLLHAGVWHFKYAYEIVNLDAF